LSNSTISNRLYPVVGDDASHGNAPDLDGSVSAGAGHDERFIRRDVHGRHTAVVSTQVRRQITDLQVPQLHQTVFRTLQTPRQTKTESHLYSIFGHWSFFLDQTRPDCTALDLHAYFTQEKYRHNLIPIKKNKI